MTGKTHFAVGVLTGEVLAYASGYSTTGEMFAVTLAVASIGALFPDIDQPGSCITNKSMWVLGISALLQTVTKHRGVFHSPLMCAIVSVLLWFSTGALAPDYQQAVTLAFAFGMLSHLFMDTLNPGGIRWLWPVKKKFHICKICTGSVGDIIIATLASVAAVGFPAVQAYL